MKNLPEKRTALTEVPMKKCDGCNQTKMISQLQISGTCSVTCAQYVMSLKTCAILLRLEDLLQAQVHYQKKIMEKLDQG